MDRNARTRCEIPQRVGCQIRLDGEHEERDQQADGDPRLHVSREGEAAHQGEGAEAIDHVVDVEAVARTLALAHARERAVE